MYVHHAHLFHDSSKRQFDKLCRLLIGTQYDTCGKTSYFCMQVVENHAVIFQGIASLLLLTEAQCGSKMQFKGCPPPTPTPTPVEHVNRDAEGWRIQWKSVYGPTTLYPHAMNMYLTQYIYVQLYLVHLKKTKHLVEYDVLRDTTLVAWYDTLR